MTRSVRTMAAGVEAWKTASAAETIGWGTSASRTALSRGSTTRETRPASSVTRSVTALVVDR